MKKSIKKNYMYNLIYQILVIILPLITTPYLSRVLGAEGIGIYSYTLSITTYFILFGSLGVAMYGQREIAYYQDDYYKRSKTFFEILIMRFITLGISIGIFYISFCTKGEYQFYYKILLLEIIANSVDISWFFQGMEEFKKTVIRNIGIKLISVVLIFIFIKRPTDLYKYILIYGISNLLGNLSLWIYLPKYIKKIKFKKLKIIKHLKPMVSLFIPQVAIQIYTVLDKTMIGAIVCDKSEVGFYEQAQKMVKLLLTIATSLGVVMVPRMANTFAKGENEKIKEYMKQSFSFVLFLVFPIMFGIISISNKFVPIFYGEGYDKVIYIINIISPIILAIGVSNVIGTQYLLPTKQQKKFTVSVSVGAIVNIVLNMILIKRFNSIGAAIATVIAEFVVTGIQIFSIRENIKFKEIYDIGKKYCLAGLIMLLISIIVNNIINDNFISIVVQVIIGMLSYIGILLIIKDKFICNVIKNIKGKFLEELK